MRRDCYGIYTFNGYENDYANMWFWDNIVEMSWKSFITVIWHKILGTYPRWIFEQMKCYNYMEEKKLDYLPTYQGVIDGD